jgi:hypothetical protein
MGNHQLQTPPRRLPYGAQLLDLPSNMKMGHQANKLPRWSQTPPPRFQFPPFPHHLQMLVSNSLGPAGQDAKSTKLPVSPGPSCSPYIKSPPRRSSSRDQTGHVAPGTPPPFTMQDFDFPTMGGASFESRNSGPPHVRTKTQAQHASVALSGRGVVVALSV